MAATQSAPSGTPSAARACALSSGEIGRTGGNPLGTNQTGASRTHLRNDSCSPRETAATPRVKFASSRANSS